MEEPITWPKLIAVIESLGTIPSQFYTMLTRDVRCLQYCSLLLSLVPIFPADVVQIDALLRSQKV